MYHSCVCDRYITLVSALNYLYYFSLVCLSSSLGVMQSQEPRQTLLGLLPGAQGLAERMGSAKADKARVDGIISLDFLHPKVQDHAPVFVASCPSVCADSSQLRS